MLLFVFRAMELIREYASGLYNYGLEPINHFYMAKLIQAAMHEKMTPDFDVRVFPG